MKSRLMDWRPGTQGCWNRSFRRGWTDSVKFGAVLGRRGFTRQPKNSKFTLRAPTLRPHFFWVAPHPWGLHPLWSKNSIVHISEPRRFKKTPKFPQERKRERKLWRERGKTKREILGGQAQGVPAEEGKVGLALWLLCETPAA